MGFATPLYVHGPDCINTGPNVLKKMRPIRISAVKIPISVLFRRQIE